MKSPLKHFDELPAVRGSAADPDMKIVAGIATNCEALIEAIEKHYERNKSLTLAQPRVRPHKTAFS